MKYKEKAKAKQHKSIIIEEEGEGPPPGPPVAGKQLADVLAGLSQEDLKEVLVHCPPSLLQTVSSFGDPGQTSLFGLQVSLSVFKKNFKVVTHSSDFKPPSVGNSFDAHVLSSSGASCVAGSGEQKSAAGLDGVGNEFGPSSATCRGAGFGGDTAHVVCCW